MRFLHTLAPAKERVGTTLSIGTKATSPFLTGAVFVVPPSAVCISHFSQVKSQCVAPFRGTFKGVVMDVEEVDFTRAGNEVRRFKLVDAEGFSSILQLCFRMR